MASKALHNRLRRLEGQLRKLEKNIDNDKACSDVIPQFLAVKGALAGAFEEYVKESLDGCPASDEKQLKKLVALLVRS